MTVNNLEASKASLKKINSMIGTIHRNGVKWNTLVHNCIVAIAEHAKEYGDCMAAARLLNEGMSGTSRRKLVVDTFAMFTPIDLKIKNGKFTASYNETRKKSEQPFDIAGLKANPWYDHENVAKDPELLTLADLPDDVIKFADRLARKLDKGKVEPEAIEATKAMIRKLRAVATSLPTDTVEIVHHLDDTTVLAA